MESISVFPLPDRVSILGVPVDAVDRRQAVARILALLHTPGQHHIATPNPEMLVAACRDEAFRRVLQSTALNVPDGTGVLWAAKRQGTPLPERVTGVDLLTDLCMQPGIGSIFFLGAWEGTAPKAAVALQKMNSSLRIAGTYAGSPRAENEEKIVAVINAAQPSLLFVAYGAPAQELWIARNLAKMPSVNIAMGVGGAFDFVAGIRTRAPVWMQRAGIEWLWRLAGQPGRFGRIFTAVAVFPWLVLTSRKP